MTSPVRVRGPDDVSDPTNLYNLVVNSDGTFNARKAKPNWTVVRRIGDYTTTQTAVALWTPASGKKFVLTDIVISTATAGTITLLDNATIIREFKFIANGGCVENMESHEPSSTADNVLKVTTSGNLDCFIVVKGYEE